MGGQVGTRGAALPKKKAIGRQGWWFASVDGIALPCLHKEWLTGLHYHDPFKRHEGKGLERKIQEAVDAINAITERNKKLMEERDPQVRKRNLDEMRRIGADPKRSYQYLLQSSMITSLRRCGMLQGRRS